MTKTIAIIGAGAWGQALGSVCRRAGHSVIVWSRHDDPALVKDADYVLMVVPAQSTRSVLPVFIPHLKPATPLILCSKGLELETGLRQSEIIQQLLPSQPFAVLSGPNFASEVQTDLPTATVIAAPTMALAETIAADLAAPHFRPYAQDDVVGVELAGALKNVLAIGAGIIAGAGLGENARAALITRGLAEITRLGLACGAKATTFAGLAGIGDIMLTCSSTQSRNFTFGHAIGSGAEPDRSKTVEGFPTIHAALQLAAPHQVDLPIARALHHLLYEGQALPDVLRELMNRPLKQED